MTILLIVNRTAVELNGVIVNRLCVIQNWKFKKEITISSTTDTSHAVVDDVGVTTDRYIE
jgi:hypothetical protein